MSRKLENVFMKIEVRTTHKGRVNQTMIEKVDLIPISHFFETIQSRGSIFSLFLRCFLIWFLYNLPHFIRSKFSVRKWRRLRRVTTHLLWRKQQDCWSRGQGGGGTCPLPLPDLGRSVHFNVPLKKIVSCIFIDSSCLYYEFYGKFLFHIANSSCKMLWNEAYYISVL